MSKRYNFRQNTRAQQERPQRSRGSPKDLISRRQVVVESLDLDKSYVGILVSPQRPRRPNKSRPWIKWTGAGPLLDPDQLPRGWHMNEDDLDVDDVDGQIERCRERIAENILPHIFHQRLKEYLATKNEHEQMKSQDSRGLSWNTVQRLHDLEATRKYLKDTADDLEQLPNIEALLKAYRSSQLEWNVGFVTYWSKGIQICQPRRFDWDEFEAINSRHLGHKGFWTEGLTGPAPESCYVGITADRALNRPTMNSVKLALRLPNVMWFAELDFIHDTGSSMMSIYQDDLVKLLGPHGTAVGPNIPVMGLARTKTGGGIVTKNVIEVEVTILDGNRQRMTAWSRIPCGLNPGHWTLSGVPRLDGPILNDLLYLGSAPDSSGLLYIATSKAGLDMPTLDLANNPPASKRATPYRSIPPPTAGAPAVPHGVWQTGVPVPMAMPEPASEAPP